MPNAARKTLTYGIMHLTLAIAVAYAVTQDWRAALAVGLIEPLVQTIAYNLHERAWAKAAAQEAPALRLVHVH
ncbi:MAG: DUF2061 domain-containing protein [Parvularculaceae bacterium]|nr:DUF2061 domain-containing protein [Parvularculaceae bacterium]